MTGDTHKIVQDAIARNVAIVLSLPSAAMLRHCKSRFLDCAADGIWIESGPEHQRLIDDLIQRGQQVGISFKSGTRTVSFASAMLRRDPLHKLNDATSVEALLVATPAQVKSAQRRSNYRVHVASDSGLSTRIWRIADHAYLRDQPAPSTQVQLDVVDLSIGGMGVILREPPSTPIPAPAAAQSGTVPTSAAPDAPAPPRLVTEQRLRVELCFGPDSLVLEGRLKYSRAGAGKGTRAGVQFKTLEADLDGRQSLMKLTRIVGELQRDEVRRMRLGIAG